MNDIICATNYAEIFEGPFYEPCPQLISKIEPHIPSDRDMTAQFRHALSRLTGVAVECVQSGGGRVETVNGVAYRRGARYLRVTLPMFAVLEERNLSDLVRTAYLQAAEALAECVAPEVEALGTDAAVVRWTGARLLHNTNYEGVRRIALDPTSDSVIAIFCAYYFVTPVQA